MRPILSGLLFFTLLYLMGDVFVKHSNFGIFSGAINLTLFGDEDQFIDPLTHSSFLEFWHMEIFFIMMILLTLSAIFIRLSDKSKKQILITNITMLSSIISLLALLASFYLWAYFIELYVLCFFIWHTLASYMALFSLWKLHYDKSI